MNATTSNGQLAAILFISSGRLDWVMAWVYLSLYVVGITITALIITPDPELLAERAEIKPRPDVKNWDTVLSSLFRLSFPVTLLISGLDMRFGWTKSKPLAVQILALVVGVLGYGLIAWAMASNRFFTVYTRIQEERGHTVATAGPYQVVRHPGYVGMITLALAMPLVLGSLWALISAVSGALTMIVKTELEDRTLLEELDGYKEYAGRVRYRLLPGIW